MGLKNKYDYVIVRNEQSLGLSRNAFEYLLSLEKRLNDLKIVNIVRMTKNVENYTNVPNKNMKICVMLT